MTEVINVSEHNKKPSEELAAAIEMLAFQTGRTVEAYEKVRKMAIDEGFPDELIKELIIKALKRRKLSDRTILRYLPAELKSVRVLSSNSDNMAVLDDKKHKAKSSSRPKVIEITPQMETKDDWKPPLPTETETETESISYYQAKIDSLEAENTELKKVIEERNQRIEKLTNVMQGLENQVQYYKELAQSNSKSENVEVRVTKPPRVEEEEEEKSEEINQMKKELAKKEKQFSETEDRKDKIALQSDIRDLKLRISMLRRD